MPGFSAQLQASIWYDPRRAGQGRMTAGIDRRRAGAFARRARAVKEGHEMIRKVILAMVVAAAGWLAFSQRQDIIRYLKIKQMSAGTVIPAASRRADRRDYPRPGHGPAHSTGDFDSPARGGPAQPR